jgi:hypothetical protein
MHHSNAKQAKSVYSTDNASSVIEDDSGVSKTNHPAGKRMRKASNQQIL